MPKHLYFYRLGSYLALDIIETASDLDIQSGLTSLRIVIVTVKYILKDISRCW